MRLNLMSTLLATALLAGGWQALGDEPRVGPIPENDFARLLKTIKPQPGESPWRDIAWITNITEARRKAAAEDKPIVIFTAADGSPIGRT